MRRTAIAMAAALLAGCAGRPAPAPAPAAAPPAARTEVPVAPAPAAADWPERPLSRGDWSYSSDGRASEARFAGFAMRCDFDRRQVTLSRDGAGAIRMRTTYGDRALAAGRTLAADDPLLDEMAFSRGRFAVEAEGAEALVVPAWPEPGRVVEDCRG